MSKKTVFVGGLHGSGTSLVHRWLRAHPLISGFSETGVPEDEGQHLQQVLPTARSLGGLGSFGFAEGAHWTEETEGSIEEIGRSLSQAWEPYWEPSLVCRVEKSPPNLLRFRLLQECFPEALCVAVIRHPLAVAGSTRGKRRRNRWMSRLRLVEHWLHCHELYGSDRPQIRNLIEVRYEELMSNPVSGLNPVFEALGLEPIRLPEPLRAGRDEEHAARWRLRLQRPPKPHKLLDLERDVSRWGYSLERFGSEGR
jgi:hypothetical protein